MTPAVSHNPDMSHVRDRSAVRDALAHQSQHDQQLLRAVAGCPHTRLTAWESWPGFDLEIATCQDCGTTISREAA